MNQKFWLLGGLSVCLLGYFSLHQRNETIDYNTQVKPLLNKKCISCHGGVKQASGFSLLFREDALAPTKSGKPAIIPNDAANSEFIKRLTHSDPDERMPYHAEKLKDEEIELLTKWVNQGVKWDNHWAYIKPVLPEVPATAFFSGLTNFFSGSLPKNDIDAFVEKTLDKNGLTLAEEADRITLIRRVCLDLTGLPPTPSILKKYGESNNWKEEYPKLVDELLASSAYGERWASMWLDLARYSDSRGYQKDNARDIWHYRDWVIDAFNADMPFDQFTTNQLAGDLLPNPSENQLLATAFHRNTMNNDETGTVDEEFRVVAIIDRINTTFETWQGTTFGCVQCHSHPYDPFRHEEYYKIMAFFNNTRDEDTQDEAPFLRKFEKADAQKLVDLEKWLNNIKPKEKKQWIDFVKYLEPRHHAHFADKYNKGALLGDRNIGLKNGGSCRLPNIELSNKSQLLVSISVSALGGQVQIRLDSASGPIIGKMSLDTTKNKKRDLQFWPIKSVDGKPFVGRHDVYLTATNKKIDTESYFFQINWFTFLSDFPNKTQPDYAQKFQDFKYLLDAKTDNTPILLASDPDYPRQTHVFTRGNWLVHGKEVATGFPKILSNRQSATKNRLALAQWLVNAENPLTARVIVNRFWEQLFGIGIVETLEDFGTAGAKPTQPELLDYLAVKFQNDWEWSTKKLLRYIVLSATYRQTSIGNESLLEKDPQNKLLAKGPRLRLNAEMIRDQALAVSGLLSKKMYGKPTLPYQPEGVWQAVNSSLNYKQSEGEDQYRRGVYVFARRTGPYPSMVTFDAGSRESCLSRRIRTNTPLQALTLLNDPVFVEASEALAKRAMKQQPNVEQQISTCYTWVTGRTISEKKLERLQNLYTISLEKFKKNKPSTPPQFESLALVCNAILNLDEVVTK